MLKVCIKKQTRNDFPKDVESRELRSFLCFSIPTTFDIFQKDVFFYFFFYSFIFCTALHSQEAFQNFVKCSVAVVKRLPVLHHDSENYIFWSFGITEPTSIVRKKEFRFSRDQRACGSSQNQDCTLIISMLL